MFHQSHLFISYDVWIFTGIAPEVDMHCHHPLQIIAGLEHDMDIRYNGEIQHHRAVAFDTTTEHSCYAYNKPITFINIEPESQWGYRLKKKFFFHGPYHIFSEEACKEIIHHTKQLVKQFNNHEKNSWKSIFSRLFPEIQNHSSVQTDERIARVREYIKTHLHGELSVKYLGENVAYLSESHLLHLFKKETGVPIRKYILWIRMLHALHQIFQGSNLTKASHSAGFSDAAHFSRNFNLMFGFKPFDLIKNSQFIQVHYDY